MTQLTPTKQRSIFDQLKVYANINAVTLGDLSLSAFNSLNDIFSELHDGQIDAGDDPDDFIQWDSHDFKQWLSSAIDDGIYTPDNID